MRHKTTIASILLILISFVSVAQDTGDVPPPMPPPPPGLPLDGSFFVAITILMGIYLGVKKILNSENKIL